MFKKIALTAFIASTMLVGVPQVAAAGPGNCDCFWVNERNEYGDIIGGHWECPDPLICQITVE